MNEHIPADLSAAIATEPQYLQIWVMMLALANLSALFFLFKKPNGKVVIRIEAVAILASFIVAGVMMSWMYEALGYVKLLGLPHILFWLPVYVWLFNKYRNNQFSASFKYYLLFYFFIAGLSLIIDVVDVTRYALGERQQLHLMTHVLN